MINKIMKMYPRVPFIGVFPSDLECLPPSPHSLDREYPYCFITNLDPVTRKVLIG